MANVSDQICFIGPSAFLNSTFTERIANETLNDEFHLSLQAYCVNPPNDTCPYPGRCANPDAAGILVRAAAYLSVFFLGNLLHFDEEGIQESFTAHLLYVYSLLISTAISIGKQSLTKFHTEVIAMLLGSPLTFALFVYAILGTFGVRHRGGVNGILGPGRKTIIYRLLAIIAFVFWLAGLIYTEDRHSLKIFAQWACDDRNIPLLYFLSILPYVSVILFLREAIEDSSVDWLYFIIPVAVYVVAITVGILFARKELFHRKVTATRKGIWWRIWHKWVVLRERFPFMHWIGIHILPIMYWIYLTESWIKADSAGLFGHDNHFELTFGQILAILVILGPLWANIMLLFSTREDGKSRLILWLANLYWIRLITGRPLSSQQSRGTKIMMLTLGDYESGESSASLVKEFSENQKIE